MCVNNSSESLKCYDDAQRTSYPNLRESSYSGLKSQHLEEKLLPLP